jgi:hypothetical protein
MAPGAMITAPLADSSAPHANSTTNKKGTSMASPMAAGAAALLTENNPGLSPEQIRCSLKETGVSVIDSKNGLSFPRIDVDAAIAFEPQILGDTSWTGGYQLYDHENGIVTTGDNVPMGEYLYIKDTLLNIVARIDVNCDTDLSNDISIGQDEVQGKALVHNLASKTAVSDVTLYIPKVVGHNQVYICPGASSLAQLNTSCVGGFALNASNPDYDTYHLDTTDPDYWIVSGVQDTGGFGQQEDFSIPELPRNIFVRILIVVMAIGLVTSMAAYIRKRSNKK